MDTAIAILLALYGVQTVDNLISKFETLKKFYILHVIFLLLPITYFINKTIFMVILLFLLIFWSKVCRSSDYGLSYHLFLVIGAGIALGPAIGAFLGAVPHLLAPQIRKDMQIIDVIFALLVLPIIGATFGLLQSLPIVVLIEYAIWAIITYNVVRLIFLFGKVPPTKSFFYLVVNIGFTYYLITNLLPELLTFIGGA